MNLKLEKQDVENLKFFLDRVSITGIKENLAFLRIINAIAEAESGGDKVEKKD